MRFLPIAAMLAAAVATPAFAARAAASPVIRVHIADLDLATPRGAATLNYRIGRALETACGSYAATNADEQDEIKACRAATGADIRAAVATRTGSTTLAKR